MAEGLLTRRLGKLSPVQVAEIDAKSRDVLEL
jgi:hypothetical protein